MKERGSDMIVTNNREAHQLQTLYEVNDMLKQVVAEGLDINTVLPRVLRVAMGALRASYGNIVVLNEQFEPQHAWTIRDGKLMVPESPFLEETTEQGLFAWVTENKRTAVVKDTREDERWLHQPGHQTSTEPWSAICVPFIIRSRPVGAITMTKPGLHQFDQPAVDLLNAIANQAASTIESARLYRQSQQRSDKLSTLVNATAAVSSSLDLEEVLEGVARQMATLLDVDACALFDCDAEELTLTRRMLHASDETRKRLEVRTEIDSNRYPHVRKALETLAPQHVRSVQLDEKSTEYRAMSRANVKSALLLPMVAHDNLVGLAILMSTSEERQFTNQEINLAQMLANQASIAIENAWLYEDTQRQLRVSALLNEASKVINSTLDTNEILQYLLSQANELLNAEAISIALVDEQHNELVFEVAEGIGSDKILGLRLPSNQGVSGWVMEHGEPALVQNTEDDPRFYKQADERTGHDTRALICAPLQVKGQVLGTIQAINPRQGTFVENDLQLLVNLANLASSALANAQQFARTQAAEERYASLFEDSVNPILLTDLEGVIVESNHRALNFLGYRRDELLGLPVRSLHPQKEFQNSVPDLASIGGDEVEKFESEILTKSGQSVPVEGFAKRTLSGENEVLQWIYRDISQQVELEEMREDLMAMLVHDLQSPLGNVISSLELLRYELPPDADPVLDTIVNIATRSSRRLQSLIRSLLDINHLEGGHPITDADFAEVTTLIADAREVVQPALERRRVDLALDVPPDTPAVYVDADMISRVLINLLDNASKYTPETKEVTIDLSVLPDEELVQFSVCDEGSGIPPQYREVIFEKFRRLQGKDAPKGIGLGLAFCRLAVEAHGGNIWVDDAPGGGARFNFTLPTTKFEPKNQNGQ